MSHEIIDLNPADHITIEALGEPDEFTFLLQGQTAGSPVTLVIDREQALALSEAGNELLEILEERYSREINQFQIPPLESMALRAPVEPLFEVAQFQLGYDAETDYVVIITIELPFGPSLDLQDVTIVRFWITREQMIALIRQIDQVVSDGFPICPACGRPAYPAGHHCLRAN
jgi:uncharacterized repeat protein (TIGR03847 family)